MTTCFVHLNKDWNAEPNAPEPMVSVSGDKLVVEFLVNPWAYEGFEEGDKARLEFSGCKRYRIGNINDYGWYRGQCRFSKLVREWGEFYEVQGDSLFEQCPDDWEDVGLGEGLKHFLFYFRDNEFECQADAFVLNRKV